MKIPKPFAAIVFAIPFLAAPLIALSADKPAEKPAKPVKLYTLDYCVISGDKLGEMGKPYVFTNDDRQIKLCCSGCLKDFKKDPAKWLKKIDEAEAKAKTKAVEKK